MTGNHNPFIRGFGTLRVERTLIIAAETNETITSTVQLTSGKFAIVEQAHEFTLVPWWPVIDRQLGR